MHDYAVISPSSSGAGRSLARRRTFKRPITEVSSASSWHRAQGPGHFSGHIELERLDRCVPTEKNDAKKYLVSKVYTRALLTAPFSFTNPSMNSTDL